MKIYYSGKFSKEYKRLPVKIKILAEKQEKIFRRDPFDPKLKTHYLTGKLKGYLAFSVDYKHRIIFEFVEKDIVWFHSVGTHDIYR